MSEHNVGLSYGAYPKKVSKSIKCSLAVATAIFDSYHNELYPDITKYREGYVLKTALKTGKIHLGLGCYLHTDNAKKDIRTLNNATNQFWSILTLLTINKLHKQIRKEHKEQDVQVIATIYDSIYLIVKENPITIKWVNDHLIKYMIQDFLQDQIVHNEAVAEIGYNWADLHKIPNNASIIKVSQILKSIKK